MVQHHFGILKDFEVVLIALAVPAELVVNVMQAWQVVLWCLPIRLEA